MKRALALKLHGWAYKLEPAIGMAVRAAVLAQVVAEHEAQQIAEAQRLTQHRAMAARAAQNN